MKILYIASRDLLAEDSPRVAGIVIRLNLLASRHELHIAFSPDRPRSDDEVRKAIPRVASHMRLRAPAGTKLFGRVISAVKDGVPLQTASCFEAKDIRKLASFVTQQDFDAIIYDTVRTLPARRGVPERKGRIHILDADDLFSIRYRELARSKERGAFLGNYARRVPASFVPLARLLSAPILRREAHCMERLEAILPSLFDHVVFVSEIEAGFLRKTTGRKNIAGIYQFIPGIMDAAAATPTGSGSDQDVYFIGNFAYPGNLASVSLIADEVWPIVRVAMPNARLNIVGGNMPKPLRRKLENAGFFLTGHVPDLTSTLKDFGVLLSPMRHGTGVKTKIVEAMWRGKAVVTNKTGIQGLEVVAGKHCLISETPEGLAEHTISLLENAALRDEIGRNARAAAVAKFKPEHLIEKWQLLLAADNNVARERVDAAQLPVSEERLLRLQDTPAPMGFLKPAENNS